MTGDTAIDSEEARRKEDELQLLIGMVDNHTALLKLHPDDVELKASLVVTEKMMEEVKKIVYENSFEDSVGYTYAKEWMDGVDTAVWDSDTIFRAVAEAYNRGFEENYG